MSINKIKSGDYLSMSEDMLKRNIEKLKELFPELSTEGKIDFDAFRAVFGDEVEEDEEYYRFTWAGKSKARREAHKPSTATLRPAKEESLDWETTQNLYIEGDNLEVLKLMQKSYAGKVKMIYIDPPYNTGNDFVYKDNYKDNLKNYQEFTGQTDSEGNKTSTNSDSDGRYHSNWLNMMYPRLRLARNLLKEDGVIFMSIDDNEINNLRKLCDEIFGEQNFVAQFVWEKKKKGAFLAKGIVNIKEYVLSYSKSEVNFKGLIGEINKESTTYPVIKTTNSRGTRLIKKGIKSKFKKKNHLVPKGTRISAGNMELILLADMVIKDGILFEDVLIDSNWIYGQESLDKFVNDKQLYITQDLYFRRIVDEPREKKMKDILPRVGVDGLSGSEFNYSDNLFADGWGTNEDGNNELHQLLGIQNLFDFPKPSKLISKFGQAVQDKDMIVLDFFSGSGTTAHSIIELNRQDEGNRKYIMVQLPEEIANTAEAYKAGYKTLTEIGKERIRRVVKKIAEENLDKVKDLDLGFKVLKLDSSNIKGWDGSTKDVQQSLLDSISNIKEERTEEDVLYEILLKYGLDLTLPIKEKTIEGLTVFNVGFGALFICLSDNITNKVAEGIGKWLETIRTEIRENITDKDLVENLIKETNKCRVIFKDTGFTDVEKTNSVQTLKRFGITEIKSI